MGFIINPFMVAAAAAATTSKVQVRIAEFDENDSCACSLTSTYEIWENDSGESVDGYPGGDLTLSVDDWIAGTASDYETVCAQVTALNSAATAVGTTTLEYSDCADCNDNVGICEDEGGGPGGPGGPGPGGP